MGRPTKAAGELLEDDHAGAVLARGQGGTERGVAGSHRYELDLDARSFLVVGREHALWVAHIRDNPRVAFHVAADEHAEHTRSWSA